MRGTRGSALLEARTIHLLPKRTKPLIYLQVINKIRNFAADTIYLNNIHEDNLSINGMKYLSVLMAVCLMAALPAGGQNIKVLQFNLLENDMTANLHGTQKLDQNGEKAALIKIQAPEKGFTFDGGSMGIVAREDHEGEIWLYVPRRSKKLTIQHKDYSVLRDYYYDIPVEGARTYEMYLDIGIGRYVTITSQVANSTIYIDGENCGTAPVNHKYLNYGRHTIRATKDRYEGEQTIFVTTEDAEGLRIVNVEQRDMSDHFGDVTVTVDNRADIWFEGRNVGNGLWQTQLREGSYVVETRKTDCDPEKTSFTVVAQRQNNVKAAPPSPHTGQLHLYTRPRDVVALSNGSTPIDLTEPHTLPIGTYQLSLSRKGYVPKNVEYTVSHNQTTRDTIALDRIKYIKPMAFYFGVGYTLRSMGGISAMVGTVLRNIDLQVGYTFGLTKSDPVPWYSTDGNDTYLSTMSYKRSTLSARLGYQIGLSRRLALTPQVGYEMERLSAHVENGTNSYGGGAVANCLSLGVKLLFAPVQHLYIFANPAYSLGIKKDDNFKQLSDHGDISAGGFMVTLGAMVNF